MLQLGVKKLTAKTLSENVEIFSELFLQNLQAHVLTKSFSHTYVKRKMLELGNYLKDERANCYYVNKNSKIVGFIWGYRYYYNNDNRMLIAAIQVADDFRRYGIGKKLIDALE